MEDATVSSSKVPHPGLLVMAHSGPACGGSVEGVCLPHAWLLLLLLLLLLGLKGRAEAEALLYTVLLAQPAKPTLHNWNMSYFAPDP